MLKKIDNRSSLNLVEVLILQRFPFGRESTFFYYTKEEIAVGDLVKIIFRKKAKEGVVVKTKKLRVSSPVFLEDDWQVNLFYWLKGTNFFFSRIPQKKIKIKPIKKIIFRKAINPELILGLLKLAERYFVSWNHFVEMAIQKPSKRTYQRSSFINLLSDLFKISKKEFDFTDQSEKKSSDFKKFGGKFIFLSSMQKEDLRMILKKQLKAGKQVLILSPEKNQLIPITTKYAILSSDLSAPTPILISNLLPKTLFKKNWQLVKEISPAIFVGNRSAVFAPFKNLGAIILEDGHDESYKQWDMNPKYDLREILALLYPKIPFFYLSQTPRFEDLFDSPFYFKEGIVRKIDLKESKTDFMPDSDPSNRAYSAPATLSFEEFLAGEKKKVLIKNLKIERRLKTENYFFSTFFKEKILSILAQKKWVFLLASRGGTASFVVCGDCGHIPLCPDCKKPLFLKSKEKLICENCSFSQSGLVPCQKCQGNNFYFSGLGIEAIKEALGEMKKELNFEILIAPESKSSYEEICQFFKKIIASYKKPIVFVGYSGMISVLRIFNSRLGLAAAPLFDSFLMHSEFRSEEKACSRFFNLLSIAPLMILQSFKIDHPFFQKITKKNYSSFFPFWFRERKSFLYPPFCELIKLEVSGKNLKEVDRKTDNLLKIFASKPGVLGVFRPESFFSLKKKNYFGRVILKVQKRIDLKAFFLKEGAGVKVDIDPENLF